MEKLRSIFLWTLRGIISLGFLLASSGKLFQSEAVINMFQEWGYVNGFYLLIGICELLLAILILVPKTSLYSAIGLIILMTGALGTHLLHDPLLEIIRPLVFMVLLAAVLYLEMKKREVKI